jgi:hypothetical protein
MIKLSANLSKKVPLPQVEYSSQQYGASLEIEVSDSADAGEITGKLKSIYDLLERSIDEQIAAKAAKPAVEAESRRPLFSSGSKPAANNAPAGGNGNGRNGHASPAQIKAIFAVCKDKNMSRDELIALLKGEFNLARPDDLTVKQASDLIGRLQKVAGART